MDHYNTILSQNYLPAITFPTRITDTSATIIDNILVKLDNKTINDEIESGNIYNDITDHLPNVIMIKSSEKQYDKETKRPLIRLQGPKNIAKFKEYLSKANFETLYEMKDPNSVLDIIYREYNEAFERAFPLVQLSRKRMKDKKWITPGIRKSINRKSYLYRSFLREPTDTNKENYRKYRNILTNVMRKAQEMYYRCLINDKKKNLKALWEIFSPIINPQKSKTKKDITKINYGETTLTNSKYISNALNDHFVNIGSKLLGNRSPKSGRKSFEHYLTTSSENSIYLFPTSKKELNKIVTGLKIKKSPGDDLITNKLLKLCTNLLPLEYLCNLILKTGKFPELLKIGKVIPIHKGKDTEDPNNYRPITLLNGINKIIEKIIYNRIYTFLEKKSVFHNYQFGFRNNHSTTLALINTIEAIRQSMENRDFTLGIFLDLTKAFDLVNHEILKHKLYRYGIRGPAATLIKSYLENRKQYVQIGQYKSKLKDVKMGVPQGSVLAPLFFLVYINDLKESTKEKLHMYADDTSIFISGKDPQKLQEDANQCLEHIMSWFDANNLIINETKTNYIVFSGGKQIPSSLNEIMINGKKITRSDTVKYLGVVLDSKLKFDQHITHVCKGLVKVISAFKMLKYKVPNECKIQLYNAYCHSKINYGIEIYGTAANKYINRVEVLQKRALKTLFHLDPLTSSIVLRKKYKVMAIKDHLKLNLAKFIYKCKTQEVPNIFFGYFQSVSGSDYPNTRNRGKLQLPKVRTEQAKKMIKYTGACVWNLVTDDMPLDSIMMNSSLSSFQKTIKDYFFMKFLTGNGGSG